mmetsp:Transcript_1996/g.6303  ORF Transcript_1996/g.6303 Transcript_1996/m.6303 type:complete len:133 (-) Transcript_1996:1542-1940(-)
MKSVSLSSATLHVREGKEVRSLPVNGKKWRGTEKHAPASAAVRASVQGPAKRARARQEAIRAERAAFLAKRAEIKEAVRAENAAKAAAKRDARRRRQENIAKTARAQVISNPATIKRLSKIQARSVKYRKTI